ECEACMTMGVPIFHSATRNTIRKPPLWEAAAGHRNLILDPRSHNVRIWNRLILLARALALAVDPVFFFSISIGPRPCIHMNRSAAEVASALRTCLDLAHACHLLIQFRLAYVSRESLVVGCGKLEWNARAIASHYLLCSHGFWFDLFVLLPIPQIVYLWLVPWLLRQNKIWEMMKLAQITFFLQFIPKVYHLFSLMRRMREAAGYVFGTVWWGFTLNLIAYSLASHASGGCWYILSIERAAMCLSQTRALMSCNRETWIQYFHTNSSTKKSVCFEENQTSFPYGIYQFALPLMTSNAFTIKLLYANLWGLMALSTMGNNLEPTSQSLEVVFSISMVLGGLLLFTTLIGNIQVFLHAIMMQRRKMQLHYREMEWWMRHRRLPEKLRRRVRRYEHWMWETRRGQDEMALIQGFPEGLRRDVKRCIWLHDIRKIPLFFNLGDLVLDSICDRVKPLAYSKHEKIIREGDPVQRIVFIMKGRVRRMTKAEKTTTSLLETGAFLGDELIPWCLRRPFFDRLPASGATFTCTRPVEAFAVESSDLKYITDQFRFQFANEGLKRTMRYYSSNWRTWAAVNIQLAWRQYLKRVQRLPEDQLPANVAGDNRRPALSSLRPYDHL
ncbi:cyclic nucleotide-gated ion channel 2, partial [Genlisea aurea]